jgi:hypothetical protein
MRDASQHRGLTFAVHCHKCQDRRLASVFDGSVPIQLVAMIMLVRANKGLQHALKSRWSGFFQLGKAAAIIEAKS